MTPGLLAVSDRMRETRAQRNPEMIARLQSLGVDITYQEVQAAAGVPDSARDDDAALSATGIVVGRPHIGQVLVEKGYARSVHEAFVKYIGYGGAAHVRRDPLGADEAIDAIHQAGGAAVLAHPIQLRLPDDLLEHAVARLADLGLDGIETRHSEHTPAHTEQYNTYAQRFSLIATGGSDYHGARKHVKIGSVTITDTTVEQLLSKTNRLK